MLSKQTQNLQANLLLYNLLTDTEKEEFEANLILIHNYNNVTEYLKKKPYENFYEFITNAFNWARTLQGGSYWAEIANRQTSPVTAVVIEDSVRKYQQLREMAEENQKLKVELIKLGTTKFQNRHSISWKDVESLFQQHCRYTSTYVHSFQDLFLFLEEFFEQPTSIISRKDEANQTV